MEQISFSEQIRIALSKPRWYKNLLEQKPGKHFLYFVILLILITIIRFVIPVTAFVQSVGGAENLFMNGIPSFTMSDGKLSVEQVVDEQMGEVRIFIDTSKEAFTMADGEALANETEGTMPIVYMISKTNMVCNYSMLPLEFKDISFATIDNSLLLKAFPATMCMVGLCNFVAMVVTYLANGLLFAVFGFLLNKALNLKLKFGQVFLIALYALSVEMLINAVLEVLGMSLLYYIGSLVGIFITCNYVCKGMGSLVNREM